MVAAVEVGGDFESGLGFRLPTIVENLLVGIEGLARPVPRDLGEETVFDGIPLARISNRREPA